MVDEGQVITAHAVIDNKGHPGWPTGAAPDYGEPGPRVAGCKGDDTTCSWRAVHPSTYPPAAGAPGGGYSDYTMGFCGFFGCANSQDFYYVLPHKSAISGMVVDPYGYPVGNAEVKISGKSNGTAVTGADGFYNALVDPGQYTVSASVDIKGQEYVAQPTECFHRHPERGWGQLFSGH